MRKYLVGLTGGIGSGKSAAAERFAAHGIACVDADIASRAVVEPGTTALSQIVDYFGQTMLNDDKHLNRSALRHVVFADTNKRQWLQQLLHPLITNYLKTHIAQASSAYVVLVNPLLIETRQNHWCDRVLVIDVPEALQLARTTTRDNNTPEQVQNIMRAQLDRKSRLEAADDIIVNDQSRSQLAQDVDHLHNIYEQLCQKPLV